MDTVPVPMCTNIEEAKQINSNYESHVLSSFIKQLDSNNIGGPTYGL